MAVHAEDLTTVAEVKVLLGISVATYDTLLQTLITAASFWIQQFCDRNFHDTGSDITELLDGGGKYFKLRRFPNVSVTSISYSQEDNLASPTYTAYSSATDYKVDADTGEVFFIGNTPCGKRNIKVVYSGGYETPSSEAPENVRLACQKLVAKYYNKRRSEGITNESIGGASIAWRDELDMELKLLLEPLRNLSI